MRIIASVYVEDVSHKRVTCLSRPAERLNLLAQPQVFLVVVAAYMSIPILVAIFPRSSRTGRLTSATRVFIMSKMFRGLTTVLALAGMAFLAQTSRAADYPTRNITLVVPYPPGGGVDAMARVVAQKLSDVFHQTVIVDNRAGAGGTTGTRMVARAKPGAYT